MFEWYKKEAPVFTGIARGVGGFGFGKAAAASSLLNYFGDGSDGSLSTSGNVTETVQNKNGSYDGDMLVKQYTSLTVNAGHTYTTDQPCRGMLIYVQGDCTINGTLSMSARGAAADPTTSGASDGNAVNAGGLQYGFLYSGGTDSLTMQESVFNGCGNAARTAIANASSGSGTNYQVHTIPRSSSNGSARPSVSNNGDLENPADIRGGNASYGSSAFGGGGAGGQAYETFDGQGGAGGNSTCFTGGSGGGGAAGGGAANSGHRGSDAASNGGQGGTGGNHNESASRPKGTGGAGNPGGADGSIGTNGENNAGDGTGGLLILIVGGTLTIGSSGSIQANGTQGGDSTATTDNSSMGGGSGGGHIMIICPTITANGSTISAGNYVGEAGSPLGSANVWGERTYNLQAWGGRGGKNGNTTGCPQQDLYTGTTVTRQGGAGGKGLISVYTGEGVVL